MQPKLRSLCKQPLEGAMRLPDLCGQSFDIAAGRFGVNARHAGILQFDLETLKVDHTVPLSCR
jgi:hypothetical protein